MSMRTPYKPARFERNHFEVSFLTVGGTETETTIASGTDDVVNRSTSFPTGAIMTRISCRLWAIDTAAVTGKHQCAMFYQAGAENQSSMIAAWFSTTNPIIETNVDARRNILSKHVSTNYVVSGQTEPLRFHCFWKGRKLIHDGDDILLCSLDTTATNWYGVVDYTFVR